MLRYNYQINKSQQLTAGFYRWFDIYVSIIDYRYKVKLP